MLNTKHIVQILLLILLLCHLVEAVPVLDQEQIIWDFANYRPSVGYKVGQSFTAGITGTLKQIEMGFLKQIDGDGIVEVFQGLGYAEDPLLQTVGVDIYSVDNGEINYNSFLVHIPIVNGQQYTFRFVPNPLTMPDPFYYGVSNNNPYPRGTATNIANDDYVEFSVTDIVFRTWVEPIPEPTTIGLLALGGLTLLRRRKTNI
jgi:hypothetical protein